MALMSNNLRQEQVNHFKC